MCIVFVKECSLCFFLLSSRFNSDIAMHFIERYKLACVKVTSKFQLRRICKAVGATALVRLGAPTAEELGHCDVLTTDEIGSTRVTIFRQDKEVRLAHAYAHAHAHARTCTHTHATRTHPLRKDLHA